MLTFSVSPLANAPRIAVTNAIKYARALAYFAMVATWSPWYTPVATATRHMTATSHSR